MAWLERRRRSWQAAKRLGEVQATLEPRITEWDFLAGGNSRRSRKRAGTPGTETSYYREEKKANAMPVVTASETGTGQTEPGDESHWGCGVVGLSPISRTGNRDGWKAVS